MCKVKMGEQVRTPQDLQNLVTSVILRQTRPFTADSIEVQVKERLTGSPFLVGPHRSQVGQVCKRTLQYMAMSRGIRSAGMGDKQYRLTMSFPSYTPVTANGN